MPLLYFRKSLPSSSFSNSPDAIQQFVCIYLKPVTAAIAVCVLFSFLIALLLAALAGGLQRNTAPDTTLNPSHISHQNNPAAFIKNQNQEDLSVLHASDGYSCVALHRKVVYRLNGRTTYQEVATTEQSFVSHITQQLDEQGIAYEVVRNSSNTVLVDKNGWVVSWGGLLYLPRVDLTFVE